LPSTESGSNKKGFPGDRLLVHLEELKKPQPSLTGGFLFRKTTYILFCMKHINCHTSAGSFWFIGWLFSIGFLHLSFWKGVLALIVWPYYLGDFISALL